MDCHSVQEQLSLYIEGDIPYEEKLRIDNHLKSCRSCNESLAGMRKTIQLVNNLEDIDPPYWLTQKIMGRVKAEAKPKKGFWKTIFYPLHIKLPIEAAAVVIIAITSVYIFKTMQPETQFAPEPPAEVTDTLTIQPHERATQKDKDSIRKHITVDTVAKEPGRFSPPLPHQYRAGAPGETVRDKADTGKPEPRTEDLHTEHSAEADRSSGVAESREGQVPSRGSAEEGLPKRGESASLQMKALPEKEKASVLLTVYAEDTGRAGEEIMKAVGQFHGKTRGRQTAAGRDVIYAKIDCVNLYEFIEKTKLYGQINEKWPVPEGCEGTIEIRIEIFRKP